MATARETTGPRSDLIADRTEYGVRLTSNAAKHELWERIRAGVARLAAEPGTRALAIAGAGERASMAGAELGEFPTVLRDRERSRQYLAKLTNTLDLIEDVHPVIAAIGGGPEVAAACDYRVAVDTASFGIPSADIGLAIAYTDIERLGALVGAGMAREILLFGKLYSATEALAMGLISEIVPRATLVERATELANEVARKAPLSIASAKKVLKSTVHAILSSSNGYFQAALQSTDDTARSYVAASIDS